MDASGILTSIAILFLGAVIWDDLRQSGRVTPVRKTLLLVACILALVSAVLELLL